MSAELQAMEITGYEMPRSGLPHRVIPAIVGGVFAGLLLVGLGCTPLFKKPKSAEQGMIVHAKSAASPFEKNVSGTTSGSSSGVVNPAPMNVITPKPGSTGVTPPRSSTSGGMPTVAASSSKRGGVVSGDSAAHSFAIQCNPTHPNDDPKGLRPETASLQGIMAGSSKAALLDGVLYREGDRFGSNVCPWTVAMIDAGSVRIEKAFGDRTAGVTIFWQTSKNQITQPRAAAPSAPAATVASSKKSR